MGSRIASVFPEESVLHCRAGTMALNGKVYEKSAASFRKALSLNPMLWEAFEGLCSMGESGRVTTEIFLDSFRYKGNIPEIDELFPPRPTPVKRAAHDEPPPVFPYLANTLPNASVVGLFTPSQGSTGNLFHNWRPDHAQSHPFRIDTNT
jgi:anaphase-promoting complex subunit 3